MGFCFLHGGVFCVSLMLCLTILIEDIEILCEKGDSDCDPCPRNEVNNLIHIEILQ